MITGTAANYCIIINLRFIFIEKFTVISPARVDLNIFLNVKAMYSLEETSSLAAKIFSQFCVIFQNSRFAEKKMELT